MHEHRPKDRHEGLTGFGRHPRLGDTRPGVHAPLTTEDARAALEGILGYSRSGRSSFCDTGVVPGVSWDDTQRRGAAERAAMSRHDTAIRSEHRPVAHSNDLGGRRLGRLFQWRDLWQLRVGGGGRSRADRCRGDRSFHK